MARDLKNFAKGRGKNVGKAGGASADVSENLKKNLRELEGKSQDELMERLLSEVEQGKKNGTFSRETLEEFVKNVSPMLGEAERERLREIMRKLS